MKINFHQVHANPYFADEPNALMLKFKKLYDNYRIERKILHNKEKILEDSQEELRQVLKTKEELSKIIMALYCLCASLEKFERELRKTISYIESGNQYLTAGYIYPLSTKTRNMRSPIDSIWSTLENLKIISEFADCSAGYANGMLCSGTNAWGAFYAVRGKVPQTLLELGVEQEPYSNFSDIDLMASCKNLGQMESLIQRYIDNGFVENKEQVRFKIFKNLFRSGQADTFSLRTHYRETEESLHFVFEDTLSQIANFAEKNRKDNMAFMRDFRPNMPKMPHPGEYPVTNTITGPDIFKIEPKEIKSFEETLGFLWQMPSNGISGTEENKQYTMGILAFFLLIAPIVLIDEKGVISSNIKLLLQNVSQIIHKDAPIHFARRDKVALGVRIKIENLVKGKNYE